MGSSFQRRMRWKRRGGEEEEEEKEDEVLSINCE